MELASIFIDQLKEREIMEQQEVLLGGTNTIPISVGKVGGRVWRKVRIPHSPGEEKENVKFIISA